MRTRSSFDYATIRIVPDLERGEFVTVGVVLLCRQRAFLGLRLALDQQRLLTLAPTLDVPFIVDHLHGIERICAGDSAAGPIARLSQTERFHWLVAPSSTMIQPSPVHTGLCEDPEETLAALLRTLVHP